MVWWKYDEVYYIMWNKNNYKSVLYYFNIWFRCWFLYNYSVCFIILMIIKNEVVESF